MNDHIILTNSIFSDLADLKAGRFSEVKGTGSSAKTIAENIETNIQLLIGKLKSANPGLEN